MVELKLEVRGHRRLLMHSGRLSNPLDPYTRRLSELTKKRGKTDADYYEIARTEARGAAWETEDGLLGVPSVAIHGSLVDAAKAFKLGSALSRALLFEDTVVPLVVAGSEVKTDQFCDDFDANVLYVPVSVNRNRTMRARPRVPLPWSFQVTFTLLDDEVDPHRLAPVFERAGRLIGLGDWRPTYGTYEVEVVL